MTLGNFPISNEAQTGRLGIFWQLNM